MATHTQTYVTEMPTITTTQIMASSAQSKAPATTILQSAHSGQQYIVTTAMNASGELDQDHNEAVTLQAVNQQQQQQQTTVGHVQQQYPTSHIQYVDNNATDAIYATTNGQMQYHGEYAQYAGLGGSVNAYYQTSSSSQETAAALASIQQMGGGVQGLQGQIISGQSGAYLVHGEALDGEGTPLSHTTRASPATVSLTVQWLIENYETADGVSLPRGTLYNHYLRHCHDHNMDPMNPASFGKLIRSVFLGLRTRRLGTRGNSKYHYYGIRIKATSSLNQFTDDQTMAMRQTPVNQGKRFKSFHTKQEAMEVEPGQQGSSSSSHESSAQHQHQQFLGDATSAIPNFAKIEPHNPLPEGISQKDLDLFEIIYKEHCEAILDIVVNLQFTLVENLWRSFWRNPEEQTHSDTMLEKRFPRDKLFSICKYEPVKKFIRRSDYAFYQSLVEVLIPDVLRPIPSSLTQAIRNFAKSLEGWLKGAMENAPEDVYKSKTGAITAFAQTLRRYTSLNHLAQAARAVLQNTSQINQMLTDLNRVDFNNVQEQASWVCQCDDPIVTKFEQDFKKTLQQQNSLEQWAIWLEGVVNQVLKPHEGSGSFAKAARQFLLKWSFYSSMVIRDLTLRSAASFGSFHLIRLLYDEYMFYLVEHKVAAATGDTPIAVMGEVRQFVDIPTIDSMAKAAAASIPTTPKLNHTTVTMSASPQNTQQIQTASMVTMPGNHHQVLQNPLPVTLKGRDIQTIPASSLAAHPVHHLQQTVALMQTSGGSPGTKTIVVVPVSNAGDIQAMKKFKAS